jgi:hypothetical protein
MHPEKNNVTTAKEMNHIISNLFFSTSITFADNQRAQHLSSMHGILGKPHHFYRLVHPLGYAKCHQQIHEICLN